MRSKAKWLRTAVILAGAGWSMSTAAQDTTSYSYDPLGRLVETTISGGPNNNLKAATCFDAAGNRTQHYTGTGAVPSCTPTPVPTPTPPPTNQPPVTANDTANIPCQSSGTVNLTANDSDPENNVPLVLLGITGVSGDATASIASSSSVEVLTNLKGPSVFTYTVRDSLGGSSTGQLTVTATGQALYCNGGGGNQ
jgi:hypothetical protein